MNSIKNWYLIHKWTSLVCMVFVLMLCITGLPLIFHHEIDHALGYSVHPPEISGEAERVSVNKIVSDAKSRKLQDKVQFLIGDPEEPDLWYVRLGEKIDSFEASEFYTYDARTGEFLNDYPLGEGIMNFILRLHIDMFAGLYGTLFLGFMGLLLFASIVSGAVLYAPYMQKLAFGTIRTNRGPRFRWLDIHNLLGIITLVWLSVVTLTGVINTLSIPIFNQWQSTQLAEMTSSYREKPAPEETISPEDALYAARKSEPDMQLSFMAFPGNDFAGPHHYMAYMQGTTDWTSKLLKPVLIDASTGEVTDKRNLPWYVSALLLSQPLHFGDYGGIPMKVLWALLDIISIVVLGSGIYLWLKKREIPEEFRADT